VIQCRASNFWGDRDAVFGRSDQEALQRRVPGAELHVFRDVGHAIHWEVPDEFVCHLITALER
jgi:pimeloyl-ACP methyl ester carboxylesterase